MSNEPGHLAHSCCQIAKFHEDQIHPKCIERSGLGPVDIVCNGTCTHHVGQLMRDPSQHTELVPSGIPVESNSIAMLFSCLIAVAFNPGHV